MSRLVLPRRSLVVPARNRQGGFLLNPFRFGGGASDPHWANVVSLLHFDGADGATTFTDQRGKTWTASGNAQLDTAQSKFGTASLLLDGAGDYLTGPDSTDFDFGTGDFTIEGWFRQASTAGIQQVFTGTLGGQTSIYLEGGVPKIGQRGVSVDLSGASGISANTWASHVAWSRSGGTMRIFVEGVSVASAASTATYNASGAPVQIGAGTTASFPYNGHMDELRITKGVGRYTSNFTPPTAAFPNS